MLLKISFFLVLFGLSVACSDDKPPVKEAVDDSDEEIVADDASDDSDTVADDEAAASAGGKVPEPPPVVSQPTTATPPVKPETAVVPATVPTAQGGVYYVATSTLNVREDANETSAIKAKLVKGDRITVVGIDKDWAKLASGGYVSAKNITRKAVGPERKTGGWKNTGAVESAVTEPKTKVAAPAEKKADGVQK